jgi:tRNA-2-methylthio-N6-dimethylallyladenosine synthase
MKFYIETYGCQMNVSDSELVSSILINAGWAQANSIDEADLILFNTCSVRQHAEDRVMGRISNEKHRKKDNPNLKIAVLGCMAQRVGKGLLDQESGVDLVVGVDQYQDIPTLLKAGSGVDTELDPMQIYPEFQPLHQGRTCAFVTIIRGCNNFCSYCIVPHVRGRERSVPVGKIIDEVRACGEAGQKDVTLLGQNVNSYRYGDYDFPKLLKKLNGIDSIHRLRFITSHPKDLSDELIEVMAICDKVCEHIHLPMQSGDDRILAAMNRKYGIGHYTRLTEKLRNAIPDIAITTDIIAGFPGETEAMFSNTLKAMNDIRFDYAFCFKYSERSGTSAAGYQDQVPEPVRLERLQRMIDLQREITLERFRAKIGGEVEVYAEDLSKKSDRQISGKTRDYKIAVLPGSVDDIGRLVKATVIDATAGTLICG